MSWVVWWLVLSCLAGPLVGAWLRRCAEQQTRKVDG
jgi:hypothetical protein